MIVTTTSSSVLLHPFGLNALIDVTTGFGKTVEFVIVEVVTVYPFPVYETFVLSVSTLQVKFGMLAVSGYLRSSLYAISLAIDNRRESALVVTLKV